MTGRRSSYLSPPDLHRLDWACRPVAVAFGTPPYLVGSALSTPDYRDIDLRLILDDAVMERMFGADETYGLPGRPTPFGVRLVLNIALSKLAGFPVTPEAFAGQLLANQSAARPVRGGRLCLISA